MHPCDNATFNEIAAAEVKSPCLVASAFKAGAACSKRVVEGSANSNLGAYLVVQALWGANSNVSSKVDMLCQHAGSVTDDDQHAAVHARPAELLQHCVYVNVADMRFAKFS